MCDTDADPSAQALAAPVYRRPAAAAVTLALACPCSHCPGLPGPTCRGRPCAWGRTAQSGPPTPTGRRPARQQDVGTSAAASVRGATGGGCAAPRPRSPGPHLGFVVRVALLAVAPVLPARWPPGQRASPHIPARQCKAACSPTPDWLARHRFSPTKPAAPAVRSRPRHPSAHSAGPTKMPSCTPWHAQHGSGTTLPSAPKP
jgi:hypothetical protein